MEHEIEDWMRDAEHLQSCLSAEAVPFVPFHQPEPYQNRQVIGQADIIVEQLQTLSNKLALCVLRLDSLSAQTLVVKSADDLSTTTSAPIDVEVAYTDAMVSSTDAIVVAVVPNVPELEPTPAPSLSELFQRMDVFESVFAGVDVSTDGVKSNEQVGLPALGSTATQVGKGPVLTAPVVVLVPVPELLPTLAPTPLELRTARHEIYVESLLKKQGVSDERRQQLRQERQQPSAAAPPPAPQPQRTEEEVMRYMADHLRRHHGPVATTKAFVMPSLFD